jgi:hypothetical protein
LSVRKSRPRKKRRRKFSGKEEATSLTELVEFEHSPFATRVALAAFVLCGCRTGRHLFVGPKKSAEEEEKEELVECRVDHYQTLRCALSHGMEQDV